MAFLHIGAIAQCEAEPQPRFEVARIIPQSVWNDYYDEIKTCYMQQGMPLMDMRELMERKYNLKATYDSLEYLTM
jgi:hypothetical protein